MQTACLKFICHITTWFSTREPIAKVCSLYLTGHSVEQRQGRYSVLVVLHVIFHALPWPALVAPTLFVLQQVADAGPTTGAPCANHRYFVIHAGAVDEWTPVLSLFVRSTRSETSSTRSVQLPLWRAHTAYPHSPSPRLLSQSSSAYIPRRTHRCRRQHTTIDLPDSRVGPHALLVRAAMRLHAMLMYADAGSRARSVRPERDGHAARCGEVSPTIGLLVTTYEGQPVFFLCFRLTLTYRTKREKCRQDQKSHFCLLVDASAPLAPCRRRRRMSTPHARSLRKTPAHCRPAELQAVQDAGQRTRNLAPCSSKPRLLKRVPRLWIALNACAQDILMPPQSASHGLDNPRGMHIDVKWANVMVLSPERIKDLASQAELILTRFAEEIDREEFVEDADCCIYLANKLQHNCVRITACTCSTNDSCEYIDARESHEYGDRSSACAGVWTPYRFVFAIEANGERISALAAPNAGLAIVVRDDVDADKRSVRREAAAARGVQNEPARIQWSWIAAAARAYIEIEPALTHGSVHKGGTGQRWCGRRKRARAHSIDIAQWSKPMHATVEHGGAGGSAGARTVERGGAGSGAGAQAGGRRRQRGASKTSPCTLIGACTAQWNAAAQAAAVAEGGSSTVDGVGGAGVENKSMHAHRSMHGAVECGSADGSGVHGAVEGGGSAERRQRTRTRSWERAQGMRRWAVEGAAARSDENKPVHGAWRRCRRGCTGGGRRGGASKLSPRMLMGACAGEFGAAAAWGVQNEPAHTQWSVRGEVEGGGGAGHGGRARAHSMEPQRVGSGTARTCRRQGSRAEDAQRAEGAGGM
ncbi:hypothetical protein GGX14DRAFT_601255 [Mycena pura]|uniref:Uncharacterized protein n=1 Tax=Mycena pura TaxID=153505 RepID=A0AAD6XX33_9AGAR|nr:hypothetical protein GGX14DRAFT_601255 [Mycena pura]